MEARIFPAALLVAVTVSLGAGYRTANFIIEAPTQELAQKIGQAAETYRRELAVEWLGAPMPNWSRPCPIYADVAADKGAGGATSFVFDRGEVFGWDMKIQGSEQRVLDSVLPHEVTHTIFASYFRRPLPRWADEGACTTVEHVSERTKQQHMLINFLRTGHGIAFHQMFAMKEYPPDVLPLYSQGYSLARFLIDQSGKREFLAYIGDGMKTDNWSDATKRHYGYENLKTLQEEWLTWVKQGSPKLASRTKGSDGIALASRNSQRDAARGQRGDAEPLYRAQSDDRDGLNPDNSATIRSSPRGNSTSLAAAASAAEPSGWSAANSADNSGNFVADAGEDSRPPKRTSVYDRGSAAGATASTPPTAASLRDPEFVARRDDSPPTTSRQVLLEWRRPQK